MLAALRTDPALLKLDLYCNGVRLDDSCFIEEDGGRKILRTRAGLGSGVELILPGGLWTNVPATEHFVTRSPYTLHRAGGRYLIGADLAVMNEVEIASGVAGLIDNSFGGNLNAMSRKDGLTQKSVKRRLSHRSRRSI